MSEPTAASVATEGFEALREKFSHNRTLHFADEEDAREFDTALSGTVVDNIGAYALGVDSFAMVVFFASGPPTASAPDAFFAYGHDLLGGKPGVLMIVSCDEGVLGRCATVCRHGNVMCATLVDARIDESAYETIHLVHIDMIRFDRYARLLQTPLAVDSGGHGFGHGAIREAVCESVRDAVDDGARFVASRVRSALAGAVRRFDLASHRTARSGDESGAVPDIAAMLTYARGPVVRVDHRDGATTSIAVVASGRVAVVCTNDPVVAGDVFWPRSSEAVAMEVKNADVVFVVRQNCVTSPSLRDQTPSVWYDVDRDHGGWRLIVVCDFVPAAHVAHVFDEASATALAWRRWSIDKGIDLPPRALSGLVDLLKRPCNRAGNVRVFAGRIETARLRHAMARCVDANLETIKAKLWAPDRPLFQRLLAAQMGLGLCR